MLEEIVRTVFEGVIGAAFSGTFRQARSAKARRLKAAAWVALVLSVTLFILAATLLQGNMVAIAGVSGLAGTVAFFVFGTWAAITNAGIEHDGKAGIDRDSDRQ